MRAPARMLLFLSALALMTVLPGAVGTPPDGTADVVYGQLGSFTSAILNSGGVSGGPTAESLWVPGGVALDRDGDLYVADTANNRVLFLPAGATVATRVYSQNGSFTTNVANFGAVAGSPTTADGLNGPEGVAEVRGVRRTHRADRHAHRPPAQGKRNVVHARTE
jgi:hypothetical protein